MDQISSPTENTTRLTPAARIAWALLIVVTLYICYFTHLNAIGLAGPDEPRYAWIARDMAESGDWVTPRLYGKPWFEKPILYYWSAAIFFKLSGPPQTQSLTEQTFNAQSPRISPETAARLPSAIYALLATLAVAWLALQVYGPETTRWLLLLLPTTVAMIGFSHAAATDMPFSATLTIAMVCAAVLLGIVDPSLVGAQHAAPHLGKVSNSTTTSLSSSYLFPFLFGLFLGLAILAKGPAALILSGGAIFFWALFTKQWRNIFRLFHPIAIITFCLTALPWYILCARRNPDFFRTFIIEHNFKRYLTPEFQHIQPFWYYIPILTIALLPWIGLTVSAIVWTFCKQLGMKLDSISIYLLSWGFFVVLFFSTSHSKLPGYILPGIPAFVLLTAIALTKGSATPKLSTPAGFAAFALTPIGGLAAILVVVSAFSPPYTNAAFFAAAVVLIVVSMFFCIASSFLRRWQLVVISGALGLVACLEAANLFLLHSIDHFISPRYVAEQIISDKRIPLEQLTVSKVTRTERYVLNFYFRKELQDWDQSSTHEAYVLVDSAGSGCRQLIQDMDCSNIFGSLEPKNITLHLVHLTPKPSTSPPAP